MRASWVPKQQSQRRTRLVETIIGDRVVVGSGVVTTNDKAAGRGLTDTHLDGPVLRDIVAWVPVPCFFPASRLVSGPRSHRDRSSPALCHQECVSPGTQRGCFHTYRILV
jgi:hypothetical protein